MGVFGGKNLARFTRPTYIIIIVGTRFIGHVNISKFNLAEQDSRVNRY